MNKLNRVRINEKGAIQLIALALLLAGIIGGVFLVTGGNPLKLFTKATNPAIVFKAIDGSSLPLNSQGIPQATAFGFKIILTSPFGPPAANVGIGVTTPNHTVSFKVAESPAALSDSRPASGYSVQPQEVSYTLSDQSPGIKFIWVEFKASDGSIDRQTAQIEIVAAGGSQTNIQIGEWKAQTSLPIPTFGHGFVAGSFGYLLNIEGNNGSSSDKVYYTKINNDGIGSWIATKSLPSVREGSGVYSDGGLIYVVGGAGPYPGSSTIVKKILNDVIWAVQKTDGTISSWSTTTSLPTALYKPAVTAANGYLYSIGGSNDIQTREDVYAAKANSDFSLNQWQKLTSLPKSLVNHSAVEYQGRYIYVIGGVTDDSRFPFGTSSDVYVAALNGNDGTIGAWNKTTSLPVPLTGQASVQYNGYIVVIGGNSNSKSVNTVYVSKINTADGTLGNWVTMNVLPKPLEGLQAAVANNRIYIGGGISGNASDSVYMADVSISSSTPTPSPIPVPTPTSLIGSSPSYRRVFVTSTNYNGNLGGLAGADNKCLLSAYNAGLSGPSWKAWLSDSNTSAASRLEHADIPYKLLNDVIIANNWGDLTDRSILASINVTELNTTNNSGWVWTGTNPDGSIRQANDQGSCAGWTNSDLGGTTGDSTRTDGGWSDYGASACHFNRPIYCFEQGTGNVGIGSSTPAPTPTPVPPVGGSSGGGGGGGGGGGNNTQPIVRTISQFRVAEDPTEFQDNWQAYYQGIVVPYVFVNNPSIKTKTIFIEFRDAQNRSVKINGQDYIQSSITLEEPQTAKPTVAPNLPQGGTDVIVGTASLSTDSTVTQRDGSWGADYINLTLSGFSTPGRSIAGLFVRNSTGQCSLNDCGYIGWTQIRSYGSNGTDSTPWTAPSDFSPGIHMFAVFSLNADGTAGKLLAVSASNFSASNTNTNTTNPASNPASSSSCQVNVTTCSCDNPDPTSSRYPGKCYPECNGGWCNGGICSTCQL